MTVQQTKGPWAWQKFGSEWCLTGQHGMRPIVLATRKNNPTSLVNGLLVPLDPNHPDARLIAAAPELFDLCKEILESDERSVDALTKAGFIKSERDLQESAGHMAKLRAIIVKLSTI